MTIRSISAIAGIFVFVRCANIIMRVRSKMNKTGGKRMKTMLQSGRVPLRGGNVLTYTIRPFGMRFL